MNIHHLVCNCRSLLEKMGNGGGIAWRTVGILVNKYLAVKTLKIVYFLNMYYQVQPEKWWLQRVVGKASGERYGWCK